MRKKYSISNFIKDQNHFPIFSKAKCAVALLFLILFTFVNVSFNLSISAWQIFFQVAILISTLLICALNLVDKFWSSCWLNIAVSCLYALFILAYIITCLVYHYPFAFTQEPSLLLVWLFVLPVFSILFLEIKVWMGLHFLILVTLAFVSMFAPLVVYLIVSLLSFYTFYNINFKLSELFNLSYIDSTTGISNKNYLNKIIKGLDSKQLKQISVVYIDMNNLKGINDSFGHTIGDMTIKCVAENLITHFDDAKAICRLHGDEFVIITTNEEKVVFQQIESLRKTLLQNKTDFWDEITISVGYTSTKKYANTCINDLIELADYDMYKDKRKHYETEN